MVSDVLIMTSATHPFPSQCSCGVFVTALRPCGMAVAVALAADKDVAVAVTLANL